MDTLRNVTNPTADSSLSAWYVSDELVLVFHTVNLSILAALVATFGIVSNSLNIAVFIKQGLNDSVNVSLLALAISDICALITLQWVNLLRNPLFIYKVPLLPDEVQHLSAAWPHACFARITSWITVYITFERCIYVVLPLKVKAIVTPKLAVTVVVSIFVIMFLTLVPDYATCYLGWKFDKGHNKTMLGLKFLPGREKMTAVSFELAAITQISSFSAVIVFTTVLLAKMRKKSRWRQSTAHTGQDSSKGTTKRDNKTMKMITLIAVIYCICYLPMLLNYIMTSVEPRFIIVGAYRNSFLASWSFAFLVDSVNSSVNVFVYYSMSSKYKNTVDSMLKWKS